MLSICRQVGRLVEARFVGNPTQKEFANWALEASVVLRECVEQTGKPAVACTDMRAGALFSPETTDHLISVLKNDNKNLARNALVVGGAVFSLQMQRCIREADPMGVVRRRLFSEVDSALAWLGEMLTPAESVRALAFMREFDVREAEQLASSQVSPQRSRGGAPERRDEAANGPKIKGGRF